MVLSTTVRVDDLRRKTLRLSPLTPSSRTLTGLSKFPLSLVFAEMCVQFYRIMFLHLPVPSFYTCGWSAACSSPSWRPVASPVENCAPASSPNRWDHLRRGPHCCFTPRHLGNSGGEAESTVFTLVFASSGISSLVLLQSASLTVLLWFGKFLWATGFRCVGDKSSERPFRWGQLHSRSSLRDLLGRGFRLEIGS